MYFFSYIVCFFSYNVIFNDCIIFHWKVTPSIFRSIPVCFTHPIYTSINDASWNTAVNTYILEFVIIYLGQLPKVKLLSQRF